MTNYPSYLQYGLIWLNMTKYGKAEAKPKLGHIRKLELIGRAANMPRLTIVTSMTIFDQYDHIDLI